MRRAVMALTLVLSGACSASPATSPAPTSSASACEQHVASFLDTVPHSASGNATISGSVRSAATCALLTDAVIIALQGGADIHTLFYHRIARSDSLGKFALELPAGTYRLLFLPPKVSADVAPMWWKNVSDFEAAANVAVGTSDIPLGEVVLPVGYRISGTLTDKESHGAVGGAGVAVVRAVARSGAAAVDYVTVGRTESDGTYSIPVPAGKFQLAFLPPFPYVTTWWRDSASFAKADDLVVRSAMPGLDAVVAAGHSVAGRITLNGLASANITVMAIRANSPCCEPGYTTMTDDGGQYRMSLRDGPYRLAIYGATGNGSDVRPFWLGGSGLLDDAQVVDVSQDTSGVDFALTGP